MNIGIDANPLNQPLTGIGYALHKILKRLARIDQTNHYYLYTLASFPWDEGGDRWQQRIVPVPPKPFENSQLWHLHNLFHTARQDYLDVFWTHQPILPLHLAFKTAITVHDLTWKFYPQTMSSLSPLIYKIFFPRSLRQSAAIFTNSQTTTNDLVKNSPKIAQKICCVPSATEAQFHPCDRAHAQEFIQTKYAVRPPFLLFVGTVEPRKNITTLLKAFAAFKKKFHAPHQLVIVGGKGWKDAPIYLEFRRSSVNSDIKFTGYIPENDVIQFYNAADLVVCPSLYEGFGVPVLEAMACGCPVILSDIPVFHEVAGEAGVFFQPTDISALCDNIQRLLTDQALRQRCIQLGLERVHLFSWDQTAQRIHEVLTRLAQHP